MVLNHSVLDNFGLPNLKRFGKGPFVNRRQEREAFSSGKDGEAGDVGCIVDAAGCTQADNSGCLDPTVAAKAADKTIQEKGPVEARSNSPTGS